MSTTKLPYTCVDCANPFDYDGGTPSGDFKNGEYVETFLCDGCRNQRRLEKAWQELCPPLYCDTEPNHPNFDQAKLAKVNAWDPKEGGLLLYGPSGRGKTRAAYIALSRCHFAGLTCFAVNAAHFARASANAFSDNRTKREEADKILIKSETVRVLLFDDLGKGKLTERAEMDLYAMLETRAAHQRPLIVTTNSEEAALGGMMSLDRAQPILRRITEFTEAIEW